MTNFEIITKVITDDSRYSTISLNMNNGMIEICGEKMMGYDYDEIFDKCRNEYPDTKILSKTVKHAVEKYANEHKIDKIREAPITIVSNIIANDERFSKIAYNQNTKKIEVDGDEIMSYEYNDLFDLCKEAYPDMKLTKSIVKDAVKKYANEHQIEKEDDQTSYYDKGDWHSNIEFDKKGSPVKSLNNVIAFFEHYPSFKDKFYYNGFTSYEEFNNDLIRDHHISEFRSICETELGFESNDKVECAVKVVTHRNTFNPFKDALDKIMWDGEKRAETFFIDFVGVHDTKLNRTMTFKFLYAMIKRLYEPGCDFDNMLIIYDKKQGTGKSKIMERLVYSLGVSYGYNVSISCDNRDKDNVDKLNKTWVVGIDEMNEFLKKNPEQTKQFLSQNTDQARLSYAKRSETYKRHCVFYGNSNLEYFLKDYTSNFERRFWLMEADGERHDGTWWREHLTDEYCRQVLAEMKYFYDNNPDFEYKQLTPAEEEELGEVQYRHKTLNNDELLQYNILKMLNKMYTKGEFSNYEEFKKEATDDLITKTTDTTVEFFGTKDEDTEVKQLSKIPVKWIKMIVEEYLHRGLTTNYISALLKETWEYNKVRYNGESINCYIRK